MTETFGKLRTFVVCLAVALAALAGQAMAQEPDCGGYSGNIVLGELDWDSAQVNNEIARVILEEGFGCSTRIIPGSNVPLQQGMIRGDIDVLMELWLDNPPDFLPAALESGEIVDLGLNFGDGQQGWFVPRYVIEGDEERGIEPMAPDLESVFDLEQYADLFQDPEDPNMGRFYNCIIGWVCEDINNAKLRAYGLDDDYNSFPPGTGVALATSMESAYLQGEPWFGYYWTPTWILGELDMVQLEEPEYTDECWDHLINNLDDPREACAYPASVVKIAASGQFVEEADQEIIDFLGEYELTSQLVSDMLAYMERNDAFPDEGAAYFLETHQDLWTEWVSEEVAERVQASLR